MSAASFCHGLSGIRCCKSGSCLASSVSEASAAFTHDFLNAPAHVGQYMTERAHSLHLSAPWWPSWIIFVISGRRTAGMIILLPLNRRPSAS